MRQASEDESESGNSLIKALMRHSRFFLLENVAMQRNLQEKGRESMVGSVIL